MLSPRRDAVASILMNLYVLAGALRSKRPVPRYLPSCAAARKRLLDRMAEVEEEFEEERQVRPRSEKTRRWADVYRKFLLPRQWNDLMCNTQIMRMQQL